MPGGILFVICNFNQIDITLVANIFLIKAAYEIFVQQSIAFGNIINSRQLCEKMRKPLPKIPTLRRKSPPNVSLRAWLSIICLITQQ